MKKFDFIAELQFLSTEQGGRKRYASSGYRPHIEFENYPEYLTSGNQNYIGKDRVEPGEMVKAEIAILGTKYFTKRLYDNMKFKFCEGSRTIGFGRIVEIKNLNLKCETDIDQNKINLNLYPTDIQKRLKSDFEKNYGEAKRSIQELIISDTDFRNNRIVRSLIYTGNKDIVRLKRMIELARTDWRDLLMNAECKYPNTRLRNFDNEFGKEKL